MNKNKKDQNSSKQRSLSDKFHFILMTVVIVYYIIIRIWSTWYD